MIPVHRLLRTLARGTGQESIAATGATGERGIHGLRIEGLGGYYEFIRN